jgi:Dynamin family
MGVELRNWSTPTLVLAFYQHGFAIHQFFHPPFPEEEKETACPAYWFVGPTICSPKEGNVRVSHSYACSWVRTPVLVLCHLITNMSSRVDADLDIPAIAAIGWQSAGKSSLIEAISGIRLPRASGTCTR